jgi:hypothetical protein
MMTNLTPDPISPEHAELTARLAALGREPVDPAVASAHLTAIAAAHPRPRPHPVRGRFVRSKVAVAFAAGLVLGGTSLASAGVLGNTPQNAVADAAGHVGLDLPGGTPRSTEGCGSQTYKNHGQFVSRGGDPHSPCGKPLKSTDKPGKADNAKKAKDKAAGAGTENDNGCGKPPWAGKGNQAKKTPAAVAQRSAACGDDDTDSKHEATNGAAPKTTTPAPTHTTTSPSVTTTTGVTTTAPATTTTAATTTTEAATTTTAP